jgi:hypothetical protein
VPKPEGQFRQSFNDCPYASEPARWRRNAIPRSAESVQQLNFEVLRYCESSATNAHYLPSDIFSNFTKSVIIDQRLDTACVSLSSTLNRTTRLINSCVQLKAPKSFLHRAKIPPLTRVVLPALVAGVRMSGRREKGRCGLRVAGYEVLVATPISRKSQNSCCRSFFRVPMSHVLRRKKRLIPPAASGGCWWGMRAEAVAAFSSGSRQRARGVRRDGFVLIDNGRPCSRQLPIIAICEIPIYASGGLELATAARLWINVSVIIRMVSSKLSWVPSDRLGALFKFTIR